MVHSTFYARMRTQNFTSEKRIYKWRNSRSNKINILQKGNELMKKKVITVFTAKKARQLLKEGFTIVDIKPDRLDPSHKRTLFLFKNEEGLMEKIIE